MSESIISTMTKEKGNAAIMIVFCSAVNPLTESKMTAMVDRMSPQMSFTLFGGVNEPFVDCIPSTNVAESADVTKNEAIKMIVAMDKNSAPRHCFIKSDSHSNILPANQMSNLFYILSTRGRCVIFE